MTEPTLKKTHELLEKLADYVMKELPTRREVDGKIDKLAGYVMNEVPTKEELNHFLQKLQIILDQKADKKDIDEIKKDLQIIMNGMDKQAQQLDIIRTEQVAFNQAFNRLEKRVGKLEKAVH